MQLTDGLISCKNAENAIIYVTERVFDIVFSTSGHDLSIVVTTKFISFIMGCQTEVYSIGKITVTTT